MTHDELKKMIEEKIRGKLPAWVRGFDISKILPQNAATGKPYRGVNLLLGMFVAEEKGSNLFATSKQWYELAKSLGYFESGGRPLLKRDEEGNKPLAETFVIAKQNRCLLKTAEEIERCPEEWREEHNGKWYRRCSLFRAFAVYNLMDLDPALVALIKGREVKGGPEQTEAFEGFVNGLEISFEFGIQPAYSPHRDVVKMPPRESFDSLQRWGGTLVFVTNDRVFLQHLARRIVELDRVRLFDW